MSCGHKINILSLIVLCLLLYLPGLAALPATDRDEARFAQATKQMVQSKDYINIQFQDKPRHKKPVGIHWLQTMSVKGYQLIATDDSLAENPPIGIYRVPSVIGAMLAVLLTYIWGVKFFDQRIAWFAAAITASSLILIIEAHLATTDAVLLATIVLSQTTLGTIYIDYTHKYTNTRYYIVAAFWAAQGIGILIKGPVTPAVSVLTIFSLYLFDRNINWLRKLKPTAGILILITIVTPWLIAIGIETKWEFFTNSISGDLIPKLISSQESHGLPPGFYLLIFAATFWPGSMLTGLALKNTWKNRKSKAASRFLLAGIIPVWLILEIIPTKLPHYILPVYPALAMLTASFIFSNNIKQQLQSLPARIGFILWAIIGTGITISPVIIAEIVTSDATFDISYVTIICICISTLLIIISLYLIWIKKPIASTTVALLSSVLITFNVFAVTLPDIDELWVSKQLASAILPEINPDNNYHANFTIVSFDYNEPSLVFMLGTNIKLRSLNAEKPLRLLSPPLICITPVNRSEKFLNLIRGAGYHYEKMEADITGYNYTKGTTRRLSIYKIYSNIQNNN